MTCALGALAADADATVTIRVVATTPGTVVNTVTVSATETDLSPRPPTTPPPPSAPSPGGRCRGTDGCFSRPARGELTNGTVHTLDHASTESLW